jgi:subfamily B ATP-binding cassette protein MsbA
LARIKGSTQRPEFDVKQSKNVLTRLWHELKPQRLLLFFSLFLTALQAAFGFIPPAILGDIVHELEQGRSINYWAYLIAIVGFAAGAGAISYAVGYTRQVLGQRLLLRIREKMYTHMQSLPMAFFEKHQPGKLVSNLLNDPGTVMQMVAQNLNMLASDFVQFILVLVVLFWIDWRLALISMIAIPFYVWHLLATLKPLRKNSWDIRQTREELYGDMQEKLTGIEVVKGFGKERWEWRSFHGMTRGLMGLNIFQSQLGARLWTVADAVGGLAQALVLYVGGLFVIRGSLSTSDLVMFLLYSAGYVYGPIVRVLRMIDPLARVQAALTRIFNTLDTPNPITTREDAPPMPPIEGRVNFDNLWFEYIKDTPVLKGINLKVEPGELVAFVGFSGSGKTTMAKLLLRHYDPTEGKIEVDGHDLRDVDIETYRQQVGYVIQESVLFDSSILDNIRYGRPDATEEEAIEAAKAANAHNMIMALPDGYNSLLGEEGVSLSQGEKQRIAIARALLADPRILILDEATSSLDSQTESLIQEALERLMQGRTSFVIAHRLSTILKADKIVVLEDGKITDMGKHEELIEREGTLYERMYRQQFAVALETRD